MSKSGWIRVEDEQPEPFVLVLVYMRGLRKPHERLSDKEPDVTITHGRRTEDGRWLWRNILPGRPEVRVTHWQPLPEPPED